MDKIEVLVVEDEALIQTMAEDAMTDAGFAVTIASRGREAMKLLEQPKAAYRALVTDIDLGDRTTGWEIARRAREINPEIAIVFVTGGGATEWTSQGVPHSLLVVKPFAPAQLVTAVSQLLNAVKPPEA